MSFPSDRLAAHLAHLLNTPDAPGGAVQTSAPGFLYARLTNTLATKTYASALLHQPSYAWRMSPEEAAEAYFDATFLRRIALAARAQWSVTHRLFAELARRGTDAVWRDALLNPGSKNSQEMEPSPASGITPLLPASVRTVRHVLGALEPSTEAEPTRPAGHRPAPVLVSGHIAINLPAAISLWDALRCAPSPWRILSDGPQFNGFCSVVIDALRTANRPVGDLLSIGHGLCPFDWLGRLSHGQLRMIRLLLAHPAAKDLSETGVATAFSEYPVPGFVSAASFWRSDIGLALRHVSDPASDPDLDPTDEEQMSGEADHDPDGEGLSALLDADAFAVGLSALVKTGSLSELERGLMLRLFEGEPLDEALHSIGLADRRGPAHLVEDLYRRITTATAQIMEPHRHYIADARKADT